MSIILDKQELSVTAPGEATPAPAAQQAPQAPTTVRPEAEAPVVDAVTETAPPEAAPAPADGATGIPTPPEDSPLARALAKARAEAAEPPVVPAQEDLPATDVAEGTAPAQDAAPAAPEAPAPADEATPATAGSGEPADAAPVPSTDAEAPDAVAAPVPQAGDDAGQPPVPPATTTATGSGGTPEEPEEKAMGLMDHLNELRWRLVRCFIAAAVGFLLCWTVVEPIFDFITAPLLSALPEHGTAMYTTLPEPFFVRMFVAFITGLFVTSPYIFYQIWAFISPGLYEEEKKGLLPIALLSAVFFIGGGVFCYFIVFPYAFNFFLGFSSEQIQAMPRITDYLDFVIKLLLAFGLIFEMPLFSFFLSRMGVVTAKMMRSARRYAVLCIFIVAAILTPPDVVSQLLMAMPMLLLYEISILVAAAFGRKKKTETEEGEGTPDDPAPAAAAAETSADMAAAAAATAATATAMSDDDAQRMPPEAAMSDDDMQRMPPEEDDIAGTKTDGTEDADLSGLADAEPEESAAPAEDAQKAAVPEEDGPSTTEAPVTEETASPDSTPATPPTEASARDKE